MRRIAPVKLATAVLAALAGFALRRRYARFAIAEGSMAPDLLPGDYVVARQARLPFRRGAIVVFPHPGRPGFDLVKRIVGLPGEHLEITGGLVHINGTVLGEPWASAPTRPAAEHRLGPGEVFVLGDARARSAADSRTLGPLPADHLPWEVVARYWPPRRIGRIRPIT